MPTVYNPKPLDEIQRSEIAINLVKDLGHIPRYILEVSWDLRERKVTKNKDLDPIVRIVCIDGKTFDVCPWCKTIRKSDGFTETGLFYHGHCNRPRFLYSPAECGQPDYDDGW